MNMKSCRIAVYKSLLFFILFLVMIYGTTSVNVQGQTTPADGALNLSPSPSPSSIGKIRLASAFSGGAAWDSGFIPFNTSEEKTLTHSLGGNSDDYIVLMQFNAEGQGALNQNGYGGKDLGKKTYGTSYDNYRLGAYWFSLNNSNIKVKRREEDYSAENIRVRIWVDPNPDWDSGGVSLTAGALATTLNHNLGGSADDYVVDMQQKCASYGVNQIFYGGADIGDKVSSGTWNNYRVGSYWSKLNNTSIAVYHRAEDEFASQVRVRIWKRPSATFDSGWVDLTAGQNNKINHYIGGNPDDYLVDLQFQNPSDGTHQRFYGGTDMGVNYLPGLNEDDRIGAYWQMLNNQSMRVYRLEEDIFVPKARVRIWNIWKPPASDYDSGWVGLLKGESKLLSHNLGVGADSMYVDMQKMGSNSAVNHYGFGGFDLGPGDVADDRVGAYWRNLVGETITVQRRSEDEVSSSVRVRIWMMPKPDYDSEIVSLIAGGTAEVLNHNLGGDAGDYLVDMQCVSAVYGINHISYGGVDFGAKIAVPWSENDRTGAQWRNLTNSSITIYRRDEDTFAENVRVRMWRISKPDYDSDFVAITAGGSKEMNHNLKGNIDRYLIQMEQQDTGAFGINHLFYGGNVFGSNPHPGYVLDDFVGSAWTNLTPVNITSFRQAKDGFADNIRIRIWRTPSNITMQENILGRTSLDAWGKSEADINGDHEIDIADILFLMNQ